MILRALLRTISSALIITVAVAGLAPLAGSSSGLASAQSTDSIYFDRFAEGPPVLLGYSETELEFRVDQSIDPVEPVVFRPVDSFTIDPALPDGLDLDTISGVISGTPSEVSSLVVYTVIATNAVGSDETDLSITVLPMAQTTLSPLTQNLALSTNEPGADPALTGNARVLRIENTGSNLADNLQLSTSGFPTGTSITGNTCVGTLNPGATCDITITPGATASLDAGSNPCTTTPGTQPAPTTVTVAADNAPQAEMGVLVLGYGCIYKGGFLFAIDDSTPNTGSIGGKVAALTDEDSLQWATVSDITSADSLTDGSANTAALGEPVGQYPAAQACLNNSSQGFTDWYMPAICELGRFVGSGSDAGCGATNPNLYTTLHMNNLGGFASDSYWSSTEFSADPQSFVWSQDFSNGAQLATDKAVAVRGRCARAFTP